VSGASKISSVRNSLQTLCFENQPKTEINRPTQLNVTTNPSSNNQNGLHHWFLLNLMKPIFLLKFEISVNNCEFH
jgi:hypothetical protein